jgi:hypothetical protein
MTKKGKHAGYVDLGAIQFRKLRQGDIEWCSNEHPFPKRSSNAGMRKYATCKVFILGIPTDFLCNSCKKEWVDTWKKYSPIVYI